MSLPQTIRTLILAACLLIPLPLQAGKQPVLTIYTYDSFASEWGPGPAVEQAFEAVCACDLQWVALDSSIGILGRVQIEGAASKADIVLGLDTSLIATARATGLFAPHHIRLAGRTALPIDFDDAFFVPFDWGYFAFVYDRSRLDSAPTSMRELVQAPDSLRIVIQDPRTSTPGLGLLLWVKSIYGDRAAAAWAGLAPKIVTVTKGWWDAYSLFLAGEADMVLSYSTSPVYHRVVDGADQYAAADFAEGHYMQIEVAGVLKSAPNPQLARQFMDFILDEPFQSLIPTTNWMYPAGKTALPDAFSDLVMPSKSFLLPAADVAAKKSAWVEEWQSALQQ